jgi:hypothetical protein
MQSQLPYYFSGQEAASPSQREMKVKKELIKMNNFIWFILNYTFLGYQEIILFDYKQLKVGHNKLPNCWH